MDILINGWTKRLLAIPPITQKVRIVNKEKIPIRTRGKESAWVIY